MRDVAVALVKRVSARLPPTDLDERDPAYIRETLSRWWLVSSFYFRAQVRGLERIPSQGPVMLVGNHSGGYLIPDTIVLSVAFSAYFGAERRFHQLAHSWVLALPGLGWLRKYGVLRASRENMRQALSAGAAVLVYPGGVNEVHRPSWESAKIDFAGRTGWIEMALETNVPLVPVVAIGGQETALFLTRGERLARTLRLKRLAGLEVLPISIALPWGLNIGDMVGHIPLPAKITIQVLEPIDLRERYGRDPNLREIYDDVTGMMQRTLHDLADERRLPVVG
ncbi:MAG TPA: lysophospholipid acyltransferase family protein [Solirubrobacteraceae bacterium]|nr:lysophospholipid acyltransferase family protein [Solirubrobacteraceae bacterium]